MSIGEIDCPEETTEAKRIHMEIVKRAEVGTCEEDFGEDLYDNVSPVSP